MSSETDSGGGGWDYFWRGVQVVGGGAEVLGGAVLVLGGAAATLPSGGTSIGGVLGGVALGTHGLDQVQAGIRGVPSVANQLGNAIGGPWGGVLADIGPGVGGLVKGAAAGAKTLGGFLKAMRESGKLKTLLAKAREANKLSELLRSGSLTSDDLADLLRNGEVTVEELKAAGYTIEEVENGVKITRTAHEVVTNFRGPAARHRLNKVNQRTLAKNKNTVIEPGVDVAGDVAGINSGQAQKVGDMFEINGRTYGVHAGTLHPVSGPGFHQLDRAGFKALGVLNKFGDTNQAADILQVMGLSEEAITAGQKAFKAGQL